MKVRKDMDYEVTLIMLYLIWFDGKVFKQWIDRKN